MTYSESDFVSIVDVFAPAIRRLQRVSGVTSSMLFQAIAEIFGRELAKAMTSSSVDAIAGELGLLFDSLRLGKVSSTKTGSGIILTINECLECEQVPDASGAANCSLREGVLKAIFDERLGVDSRVKLLKSRGTEFGAKSCKFAVNLG